MRASNALRAGGPASSRPPRPEPTEPRPAEGWDEFVAAASGGDLVQTGAWAEFKRALGFEVCPAVVRAGDGIVGGAQIVIRRFGPLGGVGYVAWGPLLARPGPRQAATVVDEIERVARANGVRHLIVQPPEHGDEVAAELGARGYTGGAPEVAPTATLRIDLEPGLDRILARMSSSKRNQVRRGERAGVEIVVGERQDIARFQALHEATARRQGFVPLSISYLEHQWDALHPRGGVQLIFARHQGRVLAGNWLTAFGDAVTYRLPAWAGEGRHLQPTVACQWGAIRWARENGYHYYDFGGIDRRYAKLLIAKEDLPEQFHRTPDALKREFGGDPVLLPTAHQLTFNRIIRTVVRAAHARFGRSDTFRRIVHRFRSG